MKDENPAPGSLDVLVHNVFVTFTVGCTLNLKQIARNGFNVEHQNGKNEVVMRLRNPRCTAKISSSGKVTVVGASSEEDARRGARRFARSIQKLGFNAKFRDYQIRNVMATCTLPFGLRIVEFFGAHRKLCRYEPDLHPACTLRMEEWKVSIQIFYNGRLSILGPCVANIQRALEHAYELLVEFKKERSALETSKMTAQTAAKVKKNQRRTSEVLSDFDEEEDDYETDFVVDDVEELPEEKETSTETEETTDKSEVSIESENEMVEIKNEKKSSVKKGNKTKRNRKRKATNNNKGSSDSDVGSDGDDDDDEEYVPEKKKFRQESSSPKPKYSLRNSTRARVCN